jgi:RNA polymerase sigma-70 factor, ECF subfamily
MRPRVKEHVRLAHVAQSAPTAAPAELDELTLKRAQRGEPAACTALVLRYQRPVFDVVSRLLSPSGRRSSVEDVAQDTFLRVFRALPTWDARGGAKLSTWILTIATRAALNELRKKPATGEPLADAHAATPPSPVELRSLGRAIERAVGTLPPEYRAAFVLREFHELSYDEIARALDVDIGTVKSRLSRARAALQAALAEVHHE